GMHRFVVAVGEVDASVRTNWNRLATYSFTESGTVSESHFHWSQQDRVSRSSTGVQGAGTNARDCVVQTGNGYQATSQPDHLSGTYTVTGSTLRITWTGNGWEQWTVSTVAGGALAKLAFDGSSFGADRGFGYGSDAEWATHASMAQIAAAPWSTMIHTYYLWKTDDTHPTPYVDQGTGSPFWYTSYQVCTGGRCVGGSTSTAEYYISTPNTTSNDRRDTLWHWFAANADGRGEYCYTGNSHVKPLLQIIDNNGVFHGWVGVEASINQSSPSQGTSADDIGVMEIADV
ncbi:MAG TPA: hypothetical protein VHV49_00020, partial [Pseudonocardiaceae bacterium]|nr:hypothetical protein [Pseudonocardiaceae bacterium]